MPENFFGFFFAYQVHFVGNDKRGDFLLFADDEEAVKHPQAGLGLGTGEDEDGLVGVGDDDLFVFAARGGCHPRKFARARLNRLNQAGAVGQAAEAHPVAHGYEVAAARAALQFSPQPADDFVAVFGVDGVKARLRADYQPAGQVFSGVFGVAHGFGVSVGGVPVGLGVAVTPIWASHG